MVSRIFTSSSSEVCGFRIATRVFGLPLCELGVTSAQVHHARGIGKSSKRRRGVSLFAEREVVQALVEAERADEVFEFVYAAAEIGRPHAGMLLMEHVAQGIPLELPDLPDEQ